MLILAGVSISDLSNNGGIINRSILATKEFKKQNLIEVVKTAEIYVEMDNYFDRRKQIDIVSLINKVKEISDINEKDYIITVDEVQQKATIIDKKMKIVIDVWIDARGNVTVDGNIVENIEEMVAPTIEYTITPPAGTYVEEVTITIVAKESKNGIVRTQFQNNAEKTYNNQKEVRETYTVTENGTYTYTAEGANGRKANAYIEVRNIMNGADITLVAQETKATNRPVDVVITYDENIKIAGATLINADRFQYSIGGTTWQTATENPITVPVSVNGDVYARYYDGTQGYKTTSITIANIDREVPVISNAVASTSWGTSNSVTISATDTGSTGCATGNIGIIGYGINQSSTTQPTYTSVTATTSLSTTINNITANGTYYVWVKDKAGNTANKAITVNRVDTTAPTTATIASSNVDVETFTLTATGADEESGLAKYEFYINGQLEKTETTTAGSATYNVTGKAGSTNYTCYVKVYDAVGRTKTSSSITVTTKSVVTPIAQVVKVGDYVNYDAGTWTEADFNKITSSAGSPTVNKSKNLPTTQGQFGGFTVGQSRNTNSTEYSSSYKPRTAGWMVWSIEGNVVTLISAGHTETYYHADGKSAASVNILGNRDCSMYENSYAQAGSAHILTGQEAAEWYNTQFGTNYTISTFYNKNFTTAEPISVLENGSFYFFASAYDSSHLYYVLPNRRYVARGSDRYGVRILVSLKSGVKVEPGSGDGSVGNPWKLTL